MVNILFVRGKDYLLLIELRGEKRIGENTCC